MSTTYLTVAIPEKLKVALQNRARGEERTVSYVVRRILSTAVEAGE